MPEKFAKLNAVRFGVAGGILLALCVALTTLADVVGWFSAYTELAVPWIVAIYGAFGYSASGLGIFVGAVYSFIDGFISFLIFAWLYNKLLS